jgi:hypothetical protein
MSALVEADRDRKGYTVSDHRDVALRGEIPVLSFGSLKGPVLIRVRS